VYDAIARIYDPWSRTVVEDVPFYVEEAKQTGGPVVELCVGTGRIAVPIAVEEHPVIGVDSSEGMLEVARETAALAGVELDLRLGDLREPPLEGEFPLVIIPFRSLLHMRSDDDRRAALGAVRRLRSRADARLRRVHAVGRGHRRDAGALAPARAGIFERAEWDEDRQRLVLRIRGPGVNAALDLTWLTVAEWGALLVEEGFVVDAVYGWFDRQRWRGHEDSIWVCRKG
jgi:predicted RNA methylase